MMHALFACNEAGPTVGLGRGQGRRWARQVRCCDRRSGEPMWSPTFQPSSCGLVGAVCLVATGAGAGTADDPYVFYHGCDGL